MPASLMRGLRLADTSTAPTMPDGPIRASTGTFELRPADAGRCLFYRAAINPDGRLTEAANHFGDAKELFKQTEPALPASALYH